MSHEHSHGPGQSHSHSHSHGPPQQAQQQQQIQVAPPDPVVQAMIDAQFTPAPLKLSGKDGHLAVCPVHELEKCRDCGVDYEQTNRISKLLFSNPGLLCPPPPAMVSKNLSAAITAVKDEGNVSVSFIS
jgi:translocation protein SEC72